jgi:hypothetical protein
MMKLKVEKTSTIEPRKKLKKKNQNEKKNI